MDHTTKAPTPEEADDQFRQLLEDGDLRQPDGVRYDGGRRELVYNWDTEEIVVVVALDADEEEEPEDLAA